MEVQASVLCTAISARLCLCALGRGCAHQSYLSMECWAQVLYQVFNGHRPPIPSDMPLAYQQLMEACWHKDPTKRPPFGDIVQQLRRLYRDHRSGVEQREPGGVPLTRAPSMRSTGPRLGEYRMQRRNSVSMSNGRAAHGPTDLIGSLLPPFPHIPQKGPHGATCCLAYRSSCSKAGRLRRRCKSPLMGRKSTMLLHGWLQLLLLCCLSFPLIVNLGV